MLAHGYRELVRPGAHQAVVEYAVAAVGDPIAVEALRRLDRLRPNRNRSEYDSWEPSQKTIESDLVHARTIFDLVSSLLAE